MKALSRLLVVVAIGLACCGCEAVSTRVSRRMTTVPAQARVFDAGAKDVFFAAQRALKRLDFTLTRTAQAQGIVEGHSRIMPGEGVGGSRQFAFEVRIVEESASRTRVEALLRLSTEGELRAGAMQEALPTHGLYASYFAAIEQVLKEPTVASGR